MHLVFLFEKKRTKCQEISIVILINICKIISSLSRLPHQVTPHHQSSQSRRQNNEKVKITLISLAVSQSVTLENSSHVELKIRNLQKDNQLKEKEVLP